MSAPPYMPLYVGDYLADTTHLTTLESGAYLHILMGLWRQGGSLPADDHTLARYAKCSKATWGRIRGVVMAFFEVSDGRISQARLDIEFRKYDLRVEQKREAGKNSARAKALKTQEVASTSVAPPLNEPEPEPEPDKGREQANACLSKPKFQITAFDEFWKAYPRKTGKGDARNAYRRAWAKLLDTPSGDPAGVMLAALGVVRPTWTERQFIPMPATWLNQERWEDDPTNVIDFRTTPVKAPLSPSEQAALATRTKAYVDRLAREQGL